MPGVRVNYEILHMFKGYVAPVMHTHAFVHKCNMVCFLRRTTKLGYDFHRMPFGLYLYLFYDTITTASVCGITYILQLYDI